MIVLSKDQIVMLHDHLIQETGGMLGLRDAGLLDAALHAPFQTYGGAEMYPSVQQKAARLGFGLVKNHAFLDGNKRIGAHAMLAFLMPYQAAGHSLCEKLPPAGLKSQMF